MLAGIDHGTQVDGDDAVEGLGLDFGDFGIAALDADADVVVQDVDAPPPVHAGVDGGLDLVLNGDITGHRFGLTAFALDQRNRFLGRVQMSVDAQNLGSLAGEQQGHRPAVADSRRIPRRLPGAEDDGDFILEPHAVLPGRCPLVLRGFFPA